MLNYPAYLDENVSRPIALTVFTGALISLMRPEYNWIIFILFIDFLLRYIHPKLSPLVLFASFVGRDILHNEIIPKFSPPKRFAILIGVIFSGIISVSILNELEFIQILFTTLLLFAAFLQGFYGYCVGCKVFDFLVKIKVINPNKPIGNGINNPIRIK